MWGGICRQEGREKVGGRYMQTRRQGEGVVGCICRREGKEKVAGGVDADT